MNKRIYLEINTVPGYTKGQVISILAIGNVPAEKFWRDRLKDAAYDNCVKIVKAPKLEKDSDSSSKKDSDSSSKKDSSILRSKI